MPKLFFACFAFPLFVSAADPTNLEDLDAYLYNSFATQFSLGQTTIGTFNSCLANFHCDKMFHKSAVTRLNENEAEVTSYKSDGTAVSKVKITKDQWELNRGSWVRFAIAAMGSYGFKLNSNSIEPASVMVEIQGSPTKISGYLVKVNFKNGMNQSVDRYIFVSNKLPGLGQRLMDKTIKLQNVDTLTIDFFTP